MKKLVALSVSLLAFLVLASSSLAGPEDSVVRIASHGGSGTVVATGEGWTLVLSCAHCFDGGSRTRDVSIDMAHPAPAGDRAFNLRDLEKNKRAVGVKVLAVGQTATCDVALLRMNFGPAPYVSPVAPIGFRAGDCWSIGFDEMKFPPQCRPAKIVGGFGPGANKTDSRPWHGRSGGALIDKMTGYLVGVVSAYTGPKNHQEFYPNSNGVYASLPAIHKLLAKAGVLKTPPGRLEQFEQDCPDGVCPIPGAPQYSPGPRQPQGRR